MNVKIREAEKPDIQKIQELNAELSEKEANEYDPTIDPEYTYTEEAENWYRGLIQDTGFAKVAEKDGEIIGYAVGDISHAEEFRNIEKIAILESMYLKPEHRSKGIGTEFVNKFKTLAEKQDAERIRVEASAENTDAIRFYREKGFKDYSLTLEKDV